jgi:Mg2+ and Co2+ transporter CorA
MVGWGVTLLGSVISAAIGSGKLIQRIDYVTKATEEHREKLENLQDNILEVTSKISATNEILNQLLSERLYAKKK